MRLLLSCLCLSFLTGCAKPSEPTPEQAAAIRQTCQHDAGIYDWFIGKPLDEVRDYFPAGNGRIFATREPGKIYTQEFVQGRTLAVLDENGRIVHIRCG